MDLPSRDWENATERPVFGAPDGRWERENQRDVEEILEYMRSVRSHVVKREKANNKAYDTLSWPKWRLKSGSTTHLKTARAYGYKSVLHFNQASSDNALVPYKLLDQAAPLAEGSHRDAQRYSVSGRHLTVTLKDGRDVGLKRPDQFLGYQGEASAPTAVLLANHGLHLEIQFDAEHAIGKTDPAHVKDVLFKEMLVQ